MISEELQERVRTGHRLPALRRDQARRCARRGPADLQHARPTRHPERVQGWLPRHLDGGDQRRPGLTGQINPQLVAKINSHGPFAVGLPGEDAARSAGVAAAGDRWRRGEPRRVGDVTEVDPQPVLDHLGGGAIPVIAGSSRGISIIQATRSTSTRTPQPARSPVLSARELVVLTDVPGLYADGNRDRSFGPVGERTARAHAELESGMIPKMQACLDAVENGVRKASMIDGRVPHSVLVELFTSDESVTRCRHEPMRTGRWGWPALFETFRVVLTMPAVSTSTSSAASRSTASATRIRCSSPLSRAGGEARPRVEPVCLTAGADLACRLKRRRGTGGDGRVFLANAGSEANEKR